MITVKATENYNLLSIGAASWDAALLKTLSHEIKANGPDVIVDATNVKSLPEGELLEKIDALRELATLVLVSGAANYDFYNDQEQLEINITPTLEEATDMLFMLKMENELGGADFEI